MSEKRTKQMDIQDEQKLYDEIILKAEQMNKIREHIALMDSICKSWGAIDEQDYTIVKPKLINISDLRQIIK